MSGARATFWASIGNDPIDYPPTEKALTYLDCARTVRHLASMGEIITIHGDKGAQSFEVTYPVGVLKRVRATFAAGVRA